MLRKNPLRQIFSTILLNNYNFGKEKHSTKLAQTATKSRENIFELKSTSTKTTTSKIKILV